MKKLVYLFVAMFATSMIMSCTGKNDSTEVLNSDSIEVVDSVVADSVLADSVDSVAVDSVCLD